MIDATVIYYSSNQEESEFEKKIQDDLLVKIGNLPLISVTQKPCRELGNNICVGDVGANYYNLYRQMQIACENTKSKWVITAESDCLYPATGYFDFIPPDYRNEFPADYIPNYAYHYRNLYILYRNKDNFWEKHFSLCGLYVDRMYLLSRIERSIGKMRDRANLWKTGWQKPRPLFYRFQGWHDFTGQYAIINMKTMRGIKTWTGVTGQFQTHLPYWGSAAALKERMFG